MKGRRAGRPTAAVTTREGSSRAPGNSSSSCRGSARRPRERCATGSSRRWPTRNSRRSAGAGSGRTKGSSASIARSGGGRGSSGPSRTVGQEEVPGHVQTGGDGRTEGKGGGQEEDGAEDG